jgi:hypothetical protein
VSVTVWTERIAGQVRYDGCTWCSILMVLAGAGVKFPLGLNTDAEYLAFRGGSGVLNFAGGVAAALTRYGVRVNSPTPYTQAGLAAALARPGFVFAVAGKLSNFPVGHPRRRWAPSFTGFHAVAMVTLGGGQVQWLDPMAPRNFAGDTIPVAEVVNVFAASNYPNDARWMPLAAGGTNMPVIESMQGYPDGAVIRFQHGKAYQFFAFDPATGARSSWSWTAPATGNLDVPTEALVDLTGEGPAHFIPKIYTAPSGWHTNAYLPTGYEAVTLPPPPATGGITPAQAAALAKQAAHKAAADVAAQVGDPIVVKYAADTYPDAP